MMRMIFAALPLRSAARLALTGLSLAAAFAVLPGLAQAQMLPMKDGNVHEGVASCYGSTCHSRQVASGLSVRQNEIMTWQDDTSVSGTHSRAYKILLEPKSQAIARKLGIGPAQEAPECLSCHTNYIDKARQGAKFQITDGVGCEACHGGAGKWLTSHYAENATHEENLKNGLYPTDDVVARAKLCMSCHFGSKEQDQFVTHRIMGAGHPRISFELDLFTALQQHHTVDADYVQRKGDVEFVRTWAIGQAVALHTVLDLLTDPRRGKDGIFPELVFFDCHACHQTISDDPDWKPGWRPNPGRPLGPGIPPLNDANLIMLIAAAKSVAPDLAARLEQQGRQLHVSVKSGQSAMVGAASALKQTTDELVQRFARQEFTKAQTKGILDNIVSGALSSRYTNYAGAEQAIMAIDTIVSAMVSAGFVTSDQASPVVQSINEAHTATANANAYSLYRFRQALEKINGQLRPL